MFSFRRKTFWRCLRRRCCAGLALVAYLIAAAGIPLPAAHARKETSQPFPCMNNLCGCETAEQCWRGCCCLTPEQRWAWAKANDVQPPEYAERPAAPDESEAPPPHSCCAAEDSPKDCCKPEGKEAGPARPGVRWILGAAALRCRGLTAQWVSAGAVLPPDPPVTWVPGPVAECRVPHFASQASPRSEAPPIPPPR